MLDTAQQPQFVWSLISAVLVCSLLLLLLPLLLPRCEYEGWTYKKKIRGQWARLETEYAIMCQVEEIGCGATCSSSVSIICNNGSLLCVKVKLASGGCHRPMIIRVSSCPWVPCSTGHSEDTLIVLELKARCSLLEVFRNYVEFVKLNR